jgi:FdhD protein
MDNIRSITEIKRFKDGEAEFITDVVVREISFVISIKGQRLVAVACLPEKLVELAVGFLWSEGILLKEQELVSFEFSFEQRWIDFNLSIPPDRITNFLQTGEKTSGCGSTLSATLSSETTFFPPLTLAPELILSLMHQFQMESALFKQTGGVHSAALIKIDRICFYAEDIGRHNAVDKVAGMALLQNENLKDLFLICSGRISSEIVKKSVRLGISLIISQSAPTSEAIRLGWDYKTYIIGFARGKRFNLYSGFETLQFR